MLSQFDGVRGANRIRVLQGGDVSTQAMMVELLMAGFFAVACFRARAVTSPDLAAIAPRALFRLTGRLDRLRRSRWQWICMVLLLILIRMQMGAPLVAELTAAAQFILFLSLPSAKQPMGVSRS